MTKITTTFLKCLCLATGLAPLAGFADQGQLTLPETTTSNITWTPNNSAETDSVSDQLKLYVGLPQGCCAGKTPVAGRYSISGSQLIFDPAFDLIQGQTYTVQTVESASAKPVLTAFAINPEATVAEPLVTAVYPSGPVVPENTLRFYIHFSTPMQPHLSTQFIKLLDANGQEDTAALMTFKQELWSQDRRRLTLLMDPGRIKRGVAQNRTLGPALQEAKQYTITIDAGWPNTMGRKTALRHHHKFQVGAALRQLPDTSLWTIQAPHSDTVDPLIIQFDRPFDHAQAQTDIAVTTQNGTALEGTVTLAPDQTQWQFVPVQKWTASPIHLRINARLEDVAGNNFRELLDHPLGTPILDIDTLDITVDPLD
ncbi:Ig-like domain-containing protein [Algirhabdus cladophorae]|uniref:Ig-like domain-containing protein n=1 Tax=Algirhabdus cladophorae TaxID=3377108 RepID=UPI003B8499FB